MRGERGDAPTGVDPAEVMARTQQCKVRYWIGQLDPERRETHQESFQCIKDRGHVGQGDDEHLFFTPLGGVRWPACGQRTVSPTPPGGASARGQVGRDAGGPAREIGEGEEYCGCCGRETQGSFWCSRCLEHVGGLGTPWDRTFYALHGRDCPYQLATKRGEPA